MESRGLEPETRELQSPADVAFLEPAFWQKLTQSDDLTEAVSAWLALQCQQISGAMGGGVFLGEADRLSPVTFWPGEQARTATMERALRTVVEREAGVAVGQDTKVVGYPLMMDGSLHGAVLVDIGAAGEAGIKLSLRQLQWGLGWLRDQLREAQLAERDMALATARTALSLQATALVADGFQSACRGVASEMADKLGAERVSIGVRKLGRTRVVAISHSAAFGKKMSLVGQLAAAMDEALDQRAAILQPPEGDHRQLARRAQEALSRAAGGVSVLTVPLLAEDRLFGAMVLERAADRPFSQEDLDLVDGAAALVGPVLDTRRREDRWLMSKAADVAMAHLGRLFGPVHLKRKLAVLGLLGLCAFFWFTNAPDNIPAEARLEGSVQRALVAQFDGYIREAPYSAGDLVEEGALMLAFDDRELVLERLRWTTEKQRQTLEYERALAERDRAAAQVARTKIAQYDAQIALTDESLARTRLFAPFAGLVVSGDLSQRIGASASRGEILFEIAPEGDYRLVLEVDERRIDEVALGQTGTLVLTSLPEADFGFEVTKITPIASAVDGRNVFRVDARLTSPADGLRPGMEGVAKIALGERRLIGIWTQPMVDWARLTLWRWAPGL
ncbi:HlyD family efflux transporter periplasmic adaptor subunit [Fluviibacterium sp. DFM31]|uniref:HlyD family efflux transporter periplasmic adaptor subunit n=1 Tax=Meridianimarinicoccus marinus TaxID=3231483 RepID=A0ABV3L3S9_9RHOB